MTWQETPHLDQLRAQRDRLELEIHNAIARFQHRTGLKVAAVRLTHIEGVSYEAPLTPATPDVRVTVELPA